MKQSNINNQMLLIIIKRLTILKLLRSFLINSSAHSKLKDITRKTLMIVQTTRKMTTQRANFLLRKKAARRRLLNSIPLIADHAAITAGFDLRR